MPDTTYYDLYEIINQHLNKLTPKLTIKRYQDNIYDKHATIFSGNNSIAITQIQNTTLIISCLSWQTMNYDIQIHIDLSNPQEFPHKLTEIYMRYSS